MFSNFPTIGQVFQTAARLSYCKVDVSNEVLQLKPSSKSGKRFLTGGSITEIHDGNSFLDENEANLIDIKESTDGFVLFKFGIGDLYDDPGTLFVPSSEPEREQSTPFSLSENVSEVIDCAAIVSTKLDDVQGVPKEHQMVDGPCCLSLGLQGSSILTKIRNDELAFMFPHDVEFALAEESLIEGLCSSDPTIMMVDVKMSSTSCWHEDLSTVKPKWSPQVLCGCKASATKRIQKVRKKSGSQHKNSGKEVAKYLSKRNSFQLYEVILRYPFSNSSKAASNFQAIPKEIFQELFYISNQIAVGLAGGGLALVLFVASRMLSVNATLDSGKVMYLLRGIGLLWISSAVQKFGAAVRCMADVCMEARAQRKEHMARFRKEVQAITFKAFTLLFLSAIRLA